MIAIILFERASIDLAELILKPWFGLCRAVTPMAWQTQGNILLGLMWLVSGVVVYSMVMGAALVGILTVAEKSKKTEPRAEGDG